MPATKQAGLFASPEKRNPAVCLLLAVMTLAVYNPVSRHPFVNYDDDRYVTENAHVREGLTAGTITWALTSTEQANWHPLTWMSHALDVTLFRLNPAGHHFTSVLIHALNAALLFLFLVRATGRAWPSLFVAALFALHPLNVESVAWVAERKNVLCTMFFLLTLLAYVAYARKPDWIRYAAVFVLFALSLASKPMAITLPFVLLLLDYWPLDRTGAGKTSWSRLVAEKAPLFLLSAASASITMIAQRVGGAVRSTEQFSIGLRIANASCSYAMYLWKMVWPMGLAPLYPHPGHSLPASHVLLAAVALITITILVFKFRSRRYLLVGWLWFLGTLVPVIGLMQVGDAAMADRYAYIPLIGIFVMIAFGAADFIEAKHLSPAWMLAPALAVVVGLASVTARQISYWQTSYDLWSHALAVTQNNFIAENNLGGALLQRGEADEAYPHFQRASQINPRDAMSRTNLGAYLQTHGQTDEAIAQFKSAIALTSDSGLLAQTYANLGSAQRSLGDDVDAAVSYGQAVKLNPRQFNAWLGLGILAKKDAKPDEAMADLSRSIKIQPTPLAYVELGKILAQANRRSEALDAYKTALMLAPDYADAQHAIASLPAGP